MPKYWNTRAVRMEQKSIQVNRSPDLTTAQVILNEQSNIVIVYFLRSIFTELCFTNLVQPSWRRVVQRERKNERQHVIIWRLITRPHSSPCCKVAKIVCFPELQQLYRFLWNFVSYVPYFYCYVLKYFFQKRLWKLSKN